MIQNKLFVLGVKEKRTGKFLPIGENSEGAYLPENKVVFHKDGSISVTFEFPEVELDEVIESV